MKNINIYKLQWLVVLLVASMAFVSSCDDDEGNTSEVQLLSFGPSGVQHGEKIIFVGNNLDKVSSILLPGNVEVSSSTFTAWTKNRIELVVPQEAGEGKVVLKTPQGDIESKTILSFSVPVEITSITSEGKPGSNITITGTNVNWIRQITFNYNVVADDSYFVSSSLTELVVRVPEEAQTGGLIFSTGGTDPMEIESEEEFVVPVPTVTSVSPLAMKHTDELTITGTDLDQIVSINFPGGFSASVFESQTENEIVVKVPVGTTNGSITLLQASPIYVDVAQAITIILPKGTSINPPGEVLVGENVTITGTNLDLVATLTLEGSADPIDASSFINHSATQIVFTVPDGAEAGAIGYVTIHDYSGGLGIALTMASDDPAPLIVVFYDDEVKSGFGQWGSNTVWNSTEQVRTGSAAIKATFSADWAVAAQFGGGNPSTEGTTMILFSVYGGTGTHGKTLQLLVKSPSAGETNKQVVISEGAWTDFEIPLSELGNPDNITEFFFQNANFTGDIFIDHVGLK